ncbi:MAG: hypothetical protein AAFZ15_26375 [Bacteroidota bacterium]
MTFLPKCPILFFLLFTAPLVAKPYFAWTPELIEAYQQTTSLKFNAAANSLLAIKDNDPDNLLRLHVENYLDFFRVYINEDKREFERLEKNKEKRLSLIEKNGDRSSPYYLYLQADIRLQWALARLKFEEYATAFFETNKAFKLLTKNVKQFPGFLPNKKNLGILHAMVGTIPDNYKWAIEWFSSMEGTIEQGRNELEEVIEYASKNDFIYETEIYVYYAYLLLHLGNEKEEAWKVINTSKLDPRSNPIACFIKANVAMRADKGDEAISILEQRPKGGDYHPFYYLDYMLGIAKLQRLDSDADQHLLHFINHFKGRNFLKDAYQKLAWSQLIAGNKGGYHTYMEQCKSTGFQVVGSDQHAHNEAAEKEVPHIELLKARLLFDGGRFRHALEILTQVKEPEISSFKHKLEYNYRLGRVLQKMTLYDRALLCYEKAIKDGEDELWYFACRSALEQGHIYEAQEQLVAARAAFKKCLSISPNDHKTGLHQQAKAGLRRLEN